MIVLSFWTRRNRVEALDQYYAKMKTPVLADPDADRQAVAEAARNVSDLESRKLFPGTDLEFSRPSLADVGGFLGTFALCFFIIGLAIWIASIGG